MPWCPAIHPWTWMGSVTDVFRLAKSTVCPPYSARHHQAAVVPHTIAQGENGVRPLPLSPPWAPSPSGALAVLVLAPVCWPRCVSSADHLCGSCAARSRVRIGKHFQSGKVHLPSQPWLLKLATRAVTHSLRRDVENTTGTSEVLRVPLGVAVLVPSS